MDILYYAAYLGAAYLVLLTGYGLVWYICGVIWNFSPRFRKWFKRITR